MAEALAAEDAEAARTARADLTGRAGLGGLAARDWIRLDDLARPFEGAGSPLSRITDWQRLLEDGPDLLAAVAGSMYQDGWIRQAAVEALAPVPDPVAAAALAVRTADPVPQVSSAALKAVSDRTAARDLAAIVSIMLLLVPRRRGKILAQRFLRSVAAGPPDRLGALANSPDRRTRLWALAALGTRGLLEPDQLVTLATGDADPVVALWAARRLLAGGQTLPPEQGARLLGSKRAEVRAVAEEVLGRRSNGYGHRA